MTYDHIAKHSFAKTKKTKWHMFNIAIEQLVAFGGSYHFELYYMVSKIKYKSLESKLITNANKLHSKAKRYRTNEGE
jgi:hypothetical protein